MRGAVIAVVWLALAAAAPFHHQSTGQFTTVDSAIAQCAASITAGQWCEITSANLVQTLDGPADAVSPANVWADWLLWDPVTRKGFYMGADHQVSTGVFAEYDEATNAWSELPVPEWLGPFPTWPVQHGWDHGAIDPSRQEIYRFLFNTYNSIKRYDIPTATWSNVTIPGGLIDTWRGQSGVTWAADMDALLMFVDYRVIKYVRSTGVWSVIGDVGISHEYETFIEYNPVKGAAIFGGGHFASGNQYKLHKVTNAGVISDLGDAPISLEVQGEDPVTTYDPVSGDFLIINSYTDAFYKYDIDTDTWTALPALPTNFKFVMAAPIAEYGVVLFVNMISRTAGNMWVYKHANP